MPLRGAEKFKVPQQAVSGTGPIGPPADMWSLGCVLAEAALQRPLFPAHSPAELLRQVPPLQRSSANA